jgi:hypothetical protein
MQLGKDYRLVVLTVAIAGNMRRTSSYNALQSFATTPCMLTRFDRREAIKLEAVRCRQTCDWADVEE